MSKSRIRSSAVSANSQPAIAGESQFVLDLSCDVGRLHSLLHVVEMGLMGLDHTALSGNMTAGQLTDIAHLAVCECARIEAALEQAA